MSKIDNELLDMMPHRVHLTERIHHYILNTILNSCIKRNQIHKMYMYKVHSLKMLIKDIIVSIYCYT